VICKEIKNGTCSDEFWNAWSNTGRGIVQLVPLIGNLVLFVYDKLKTSLCVHPTLKKELANRTKVIGIAFDGKPVLTIPLSKIKPEWKKAHNLLGVTEYIWYSLKERYIKDNSPLTTRELTEKLREVISAPNSSS
jgi:hypothetical protein